LRMAGRHFYRLCGRRIARDWFIAFSGVDALGSSQIAKIASTLFINYTLTDYYELRQLASVANRPVKSVI